MVFQFVQVLVAMRIQHICSILKDEKRWAFSIELETARKGTDSILDVHGCLYAGGKLHTVPLIVIGLQEIHTERILQLQLNSFCVVIADICGIAIWFHP